MTSYEEILDRLADLDSSDSDEQRRVVWLTPNSVVGIARTPRGGLEIFLSGDELNPRLRSVGRALEYQTWHRADGLRPIDASRILLPAVGHFDQVAAFICAELVRNGADQDLPAGFAATEPIIELAIARLRLTDQALVGLIGELLVIDATLRIADDDLVGEIAGSWFGWRESTRDISWNALGVEIKTTTRSISSHLVEGVHQVERLDHSESGEIERALYLISIGLEWVSSLTSGDAYTLPGLVDSIADRLAEANPLPAGAAMIETFIEHVARYGSEDDVGYDHRTMSQRAAYRRPFIVRFARSYDMSDERVEVLRSEDLARYRHVEPASVRFRIDLPPTISGNVNPVVGLTAAAREILSAGLAS